MDEIEKNTKLNKKDILIKLLKGYGFLIPLMLGVYILFHTIFLLGIVPSESMEPTLDVGSGILAVHTDISNIERGDVIVFYAPDGSGEVWIKRVIGISGDRIEISPEDGVLVNGGKTEERGPDDPVYEEQSFSVPDGGLFVMGDNRNDSLDSRYWDDPYLVADDLIGKALCKFPLRIGCKSGFGLL